MAVQVITAARKTVSSKSPYIGSTFQLQTREILGRDGYLSGGSASDDGVSITILPFRFVSRGIIGETLANSVVDVPTDPEPWYIVASLADDDPDSGVVIAVTRSLAFAASGVVIATKTSDVWRNPSSVDVAGAARRAAEPGPESGFAGNYDNTGGTYEGEDGTTVVDKIFANNGRIVTPDGVRLVTGTIDGESGRQIEVTPRPAASTGRRNDRIVLRQREAFSAEIAYLMGKTQEGGVDAVAVGTGTAAIAPHYYAKRGGTDNEQWWVWADGNDIRVYGGIGGGSFGDTLLLTAGTTITHLWFAGQRSSDNALILLYITGGNLQMVSFDAGTGAVIDATTNLDGLGNVINRASGTIDRDGVVHVAFEYDDGTEQQIYYGTFSSAVGTWAAVGKTPNYALGSNSSFNDTKPQIEVCRNGVAHIIFLRGTGSDEFGDLVYATMDSSGNPLTVTVYDSGTDVAEPVDQNFVDFSDGFAQVSYNSFTHLSLVLTPHDELYVGIGAGRAAQPPDQLLLFSPELIGRIGFPVVQVAIPVADGFRVSDEGISLISDDAGELILVDSWQHTDDGEVRHDTYYLGTQPGARGSERMVLATGNDTATGGTPTAPSVAELGPTGELVYSYIIGAAVWYNRDQGAVLSGLPSELHPEDLLLTSVDVDSHASGAVEEQGIEIIQSQHKAKSYPVVVGKQGDYLGYGSLNAAVSAISEDGGGKVVLRSGRHFVGNQLRVPPNVSISGENGAVIEGGVRVGGFQVTLDNVYGNVAEDAEPLGADGGKQAFPGSWCLLDTSGWHRVMKILRPKESDGGMRVLLSNGIDDVAPSHTPGAIASFPATGGYLENLTIMGSFTAQDCLKMSFRNISIVGGASSISSTRNKQCLWEGIDLTQALLAGPAINASLGEYNTYKDFRLADQRGYFRVSNTEEFATLISCKGDNTNPALDTYDINGTRTTPVRTVGCEGRFTYGSTASRDLVSTEVGRSIRQPEGLDGITFDDDNTRGASGPLLLTGAAAAFDGTAPQVIVDSVNERYKSGDNIDVGTITNTGVITTGGNILTDGAPRRIGDLTDGVGNDRFDVGANLGNFASQVELGTRMLASLALADTSRTKAEASTFASVEYTLIFETYSTGRRGYRHYVNADGSTLSTVNAKYNNTSNLWVKDVNGEAATLQLLDNTELGLYRQKKGVNSWADSAWTTPVIKHAVSEIADQAVGIFPAPRSAWSNEDGDSMFNIDHIGYPTSRISKFEESWFEDDALITAYPRWDENTTGAGVTAFAPPSDAYPTRHVKLTVVSGLYEKAEIETSIKIIRYTADSIIAADTVVAFDGANADASFGLGQLVNSTDEGAYFSFDNSAGANWLALTCDGTARSTPVDTGIPANDAAYKRFRIELYGANAPGGARAIFYADGEIVAIITTNLPVVSDDLDFKYMLQNNDGGGGVNDMYCGKLAVQSNSEAAGLAIPIL